MSKFVRMTRVDRRRDGLLRGMPIERKNNFKTPVQRSTQYQGSWTESKESALLVAGEEATMKSLLHNARGHQIQAAHRKSRRLIPAREARAKTKARDHEVVHEAGILQAVKLGKCERVTGPPARAMANMKPAERKREQTGVQQTRTSTAGIDIAGPTHEKQQPIETRKTE